VEYILVQRKGSKGSGRSLVHSNQPSP
jgi:hypothetical protein